MTLFNINNSFQHRFCICTISNRCKSAIIINIKDNACLTNGDDAPAAAAHDDDNNNNNNKIIIIIRIHRLILVNIKYSFQVL